MAICRPCGAMIVFMATENGKLMPIDAKPNEDGNVIILTGRRKMTTRGELAVVRVLPGKAPTLEESVDSVDGKRYMPHFATCPRWTRK